MSRESLRAQVLYYHGVVEAKTDPLLERTFHSLPHFREHLRLFRRLRVGSLDRLAGALDGRAAGSPRVVITFDDGYANNLLAFELLARSGIPCTLFLTTGAVGPGGTIWTTELGLLVLHGRADAVDLWDTTWPLGTRQLREHAFFAFRRRLKALPAAERRLAMQSLREQFPAEEVERLLERFPSFRMLSWTDVAQIAAAGVEIGRYGVEHEIHHAAQAPAVRHHELTASKTELERRLGRDCRYFAFPNGDVHAGSAGEVEAAGYRLAFTTRAGAVTAAADRHLLPRYKPRRLRARLRSADERGAG